MTPVTARYGVVAGVDCAVGDGHAARPTEVDAVPSLADVQAAEATLTHLVAQEGVVGRPLYGEIFKPQVAAIGDKDGVWATTVLFAQGIEDVSAVDSAASHDACVGDMGEMDERQTPLWVGGGIVIDRTTAAFIARQVAIVVQGGIVGQVARPHEYGSRIESERDVAAHVDGASDKGAAGHGDYATALARTGGNGGVDGVGIDHGGVGLCTKREDAHDDAQEHGKV